jgi:hypothetical protein
MERPKMRIEILPGTANVVRFPVERRARPTLDLLREIAPDIREVLLVADGFNLEPPVFGLRDRVDAETAAYIVDQFAGPGVPAKRVLAALLDPIVATAVEACRAAHDSAIEAEAARQALPAARDDGYHSIDPIKEQTAAALTFRAAELLIAAYLRVEEAEGVARAVGLAHSGESWTPRDLRADEEVVFGPVACTVG